MTAFIEARDGTYWVGTYNGLARFEPDRMRNGRSPFVQYALPGSELSRHVTVLAQGRDESIWCGTRRGVFRLDRSGQLEPVDAGLPTRNSMTGAIRSMAVDRGGSNLDRDRREWPVPTASWELWEQRFAGWRIRDRSCHY